MVQRQPALTPIEATERALAVWRRENATGRMTDYTLRTYALVVERWAKFITAHDVTDVDVVPETVVVDFINASGITRHGVVTPPSVSSRHVRRATLRHLYATLRNLDLATADPARDVPLPPRTPLATRALTDDEADMVRYYSRAFRGTRSAAIVGLALSGMATGEILICEPRDVDIALRRVWARGGHQRDARWCPLDGWEAEAVAAHRRVTTIGNRFAGTGRAAGDHPATISNPLRLVLQRAGLAGESDIKPSSVTYYAAARVFAATGRIEAAARAIGFTSLDSAALAVGFDWRQAGDDA